MQLTVYNLKSYTIEGSCKQVQCFHYKDSVLSAKSTLLLREKHRTFIVKGTDDYSFMY